jgi:acyl carrier protein
VIKPELLPLRDDTALLELGILDSLALLQFLVFLERTFGVQVEEFDIIPENLNTVRSICTYIRSRQEVPVTER